MIAVMHEFDVYNDTSLFELRGYVDGYITDETIVVYTTFPVTILYHMKNVKIIQIDFFPRYFLKGIKNR